MATLVENHRAVADYGSYLEAQRAVDYLSDQRFPVEHTVIVGSGLKMVEQVLGRMTNLKSAGTGALAGAWFGLLIGWFLAIFAPASTSMLTLVLWGLLWGAVAGALFGLISHLLTGGVRDFVSASQIIADRYELLVEAEYADRARELLRTAGA